MKSIFLSHSSRDKDFVRVLSQDLRKAGVQVWLDEVELLLGDSLVQKIGQAISQVDYLGIVLSKSSVVSEWVSREVEIGLNLEISHQQVKVIPILKEPCEIPPFPIGKIYADFSLPEQYQAELSKILRRLEVDSDRVTQVFSVDPQLLVLQSALSTSNFRIADVETRRLLQWSANKKGGITREDFDLLPCALLHSIDNLWLRYSRGRFGFSVQKRLFESFSNDLEDFAASIGWRINDTWITYREAKFDLSALEGHLPICGEYGLLDFDEAMRAVGWGYGVKEYAKKEFAGLFAKGGIQQFLRRVVTESEPVALSHHWLIANHLLFQRMNKCVDG